jgi:hypothetical protein
MRCWRLLGLLELKLRIMSESSVKASRRGLHSYLTIQHTSFLIDLLLVIVVDAKALEQDLVFVGRHGSLISVNNPENYLPGVEHATSKGEIVPSVLVLHPCYSYHLAGP